MNTTKMTSKRKRAPSKFTKEELRLHYEKIVGSARISENRKAYRRSRKEREDE